MSHSGDSVVRLACADAAFSPCRRIGAELLIITAAWIFEGGFGFPTCVFTLEGLVAQIGLSNLSA